MDLYFATQNEGKIYEVSQILRRYDIRMIPISFSFQEPTGGSITEVAKQKLAQVKGLGVQPVIVEDSGLFLQAYRQFPGVLSKRVFQGIGYAGLERLLQGVSREAWFEGCIGLFWQGQEQLFFSTLSGRIADPFPRNPQPEPGLPFDPLFIVSGETVPIQQLDWKKRLHYSYRRVALDNMVKWINRWKADMEVEGNDNF